MMPTLRPGSIVVGLRGRKVRAGDIVIVRHGGLDKIKRVKQLEAAKLFVVGDNSKASTDSRDFGWVDVRSVLARVIWPR